MLEKKSQRKQKKGRKKGKTQDIRSKDGNIENENQVSISELENTGLKKNQVQEALTDSSSLNTSCADNTEVIYRKGNSLCQSNLTENFFSSNGRSENFMVDQIEDSGTNLDNVMSDVRSVAETTKKSEDSREIINSEGKKGKGLQEKEQEVIKKNTNEEIVQEQDQTMQYRIMHAKTQSLIETIQNNPTEYQEIEAGFTLVTHKKRNTRSATGIGSNNERHMLYKKDEGGRGHSTSKE
ncbi:698_t:CDS:2, partial [Gigaspora rosea]